MGHNEADKGYMSLALYEAVLAAEKERPPISIVLVENGIIAAANSAEGKSVIDLIREYEHRIKEKATLYTLTRPECELPDKIVRVVYAIGKEGCNGGVMSEEALKIIEDYKFMRSRYGFLENSLPF